jgi:hypothetical protein
MSDDLFAATPDPPPPETQHLYVDEAGTPTLFHQSGKAIADTHGCSRFFILGKLEVAAPAALEEALAALRQEMLLNPLYARAESFKPERKKTALAFHAKDDLPEVRAEVFKLLAGMGQQLRFYAVVCDKLVLTEREVAQRAATPGYRFREDSVYDELMCELFAKFHHLADRYEVCVARRGTSTRTDAITAALAQAEVRFEHRFGFRRAQLGAWGITVLLSRQSACLQAVDYYLWALQRFYEAKRAPNTRQQVVDRDTGQPVREDRFLAAIWPQVGEIHDLHIGPPRGTIYTARKPLVLAERFPLPKQKRKKL